jgi:hypothetical protein
MTDPTAAVEVWARVLCAADVHVHGDDHPTWQQLVGEPGRRIRDDYRKAAAWLLPRLTVSAGVAPATDQAGARFGQGEGVHGQDPYYATTDQAALRDRIAEAIRRAPSKDLRADWNAPNGPLQITARVNDLADAVLAVLPAPADRVAILLKAARILRDASGSYGSPAYDYELGPGLADAANRLDAMAGEAQEQLDEAEAQAHLDALAPIAEATPLPALDGPTLYEKLTTMFSGPLPPWPDSRPDLITFRERIAEDLYAHDHPNWRIPLRESDVEPVYRERAVAVLTGLRDMVRMAAESAPADTVGQDGGEAPTPCGPAPSQCDAEAGEPCADHEREQAHAEGEHCFCGAECEKACTCAAAGDAFVPLGHYRDCPQAPEQPADAQQPKEADNPRTVCVCGHTRGEHATVSGRLLCDECDPESTDNLVCKEFEAL